MNWWAPSISRVSFALYDTVVLVYAWPVILIMLRANGVWKVLAVLIPAALLVAEPQTTQGESVA
jgi:hypothetical protein